MTLAPIILFAYKRPAHTRKVLEALRTNHLADQSSLYIFVDGPKADASTEDREKIKNVIALVKEKQWCKEVHIEISEKNKGLANSVIGGVSKIVDEYGKVIVLEDDLVPAKGFLQFMNDGLHLYEEEEKVMHIAAYMYPIEEKVPDHFFLEGGATTWGWATWKRAWQHFNPNANDLISQFGNDKSLIRKFNYDNSFSYYKMLESCARGEIDSWGIRWVASEFLAGGYALWSGKPLINNIGHDDSGVHCQEDDQFDVSLYNGTVKVNKVDSIEEHAPTKKIINRFLRKTNAVPLSKRFRKYLNALPLIQK